MKAKGYNSIFVADLEDFEKLCKKHGLDVKDFELNEHEVQHAPGGMGLHDIHGKVTITKGVVSRTYETGYGKSWVNEVTHDIINGVFR